MANEAQQTQMQIQALKANLYDAGQQISQMTDFQNQFFTVLADTIGLENEKRNDPEAYLEVIRGLVSGAGAVGGPVIVDAQPSPVAQEILAG